ncbi:MAG TPA: aspartate aminotransferase family protein [Caulobacteraceae bacterium]|nr:aspartate aminotransferase family protein [Caulobacteraceae bacterium]
MASGDDASAVIRDTAWDRCFSSHSLPVEIEHAEGVFIYDTDGNRYYDASGGPFAVNLGHAHPKLNAAIAKQLELYAYAHPMLANRRRAELCGAIASVTPGDLNTSYLVSGGSEAVETAIKIARQYHIAMGRPGKHKIVSCYESYHGMTLATMSLSGNPGSNRHYDPMLIRWPKVNQYSDYRRPEGVSRDDWAVTCAQELERVIWYEGRDTVAAFIATPHGCGSDYAVVPPERYWREVRRICDENDVLLIADEVVTGFGRTGKWFAMEHFDVLPDIMTMAKGICSAYVPLGAVAVSDKINAPFAAGANFVHGFTYGGHPLACAAGLAVIQTIMEDGLIEQVQHRSRQLFGHADRLLAHPAVADVRGWGLFMVLELVQPRTDGVRTFFRGKAEAEKRFQEIALANGLALYSTLYGARRSPAVSRGLPMWVVPPFVISPHELDDLVDRLDRTLHHWEQAMAPYDEAEYA